ncbi:Fis family transcriptional regulator [Saccharibacillus sp. O23]|uniref:sigma-54-dependent transcriptional regulator n=1 Tax=Saccharibacillus sp. O23 TaxID=2009338 RepID=UPI000B4E1697|nr:sigma-54-dependent Fis family transcriptional regulator [Saccharibacillus sp. O23]OWR32632.1 Fis family transcriptional regulator [Saccharibacillus sp. O23]
MNINVHIIAPYPSMATIIEECVPLFPDLNIGYSVGDLENGVELAIEAERGGADILISRGGTARSIKRAVTVPVIDVQLSGYDMIRSLTLAGSLKEKTAIVGFANLTSGAQAIIDLLDLPLKAFTVTDSSEVPALILDLKSRDYKQIVGDVITLKTANEYGLKGFLIQSGRESIRNALEDARLVYGYLHRNDRLVRVLERFLQSSYPNLVVADERSRVVYARTADFDRNPLTEEHLAALGSKLNPDGTPTSEKLTLDGRTLIAEGRRLDVDGEIYALYVLRQGVGQETARHTGLFPIRAEDPGPVAEASPAIRRLYEQLRALYRGGDSFCLYGPKGSGKNFVVDHVHREASPEGVLLAIDAERADLRKAAGEIPADATSVKLLNASRTNDERQLANLVRDLADRGIRLILIEDGSPPPSLLGIADAVRLPMPTLDQRREDVLPLARIFLADCHHRLGTDAVKIQTAAEELLLEQDYPDQINGLKRRIKELAIAETGYVIRAETVRKTTPEPLSVDDWRVPGGTLKEIEQRIIESVLREENHNQSRTAERLGINRATLWRKLKE